MAVTTISTEGIETKSHTDSIPAKTFISSLHGYGVAAAPVVQKLYLSFAPYGGGGSWEKKLELTLKDFTPTNMVFSPHTLDAVNIQISTGGNQNSPRTDVTSAVKVTDDYTVVDNDDGTFTVTKV